MLVRQPDAKSGGLTMAQRMVAVVVSSYADFDTGDNAHPSLSTIAAGAGLGRRHAASQIAALVESGWLERTAPSKDDQRRLHRTTRYALTVPDRLLAGSALELVQPSSLSSAPRSTRASARSNTGLVHPSALNPVIDQRARRARRAREVRPPWCGECDDERTRMVEDPSTRDPRFCPRCHPRALAAAP